jgi:hypothetical protein
VNKKEVKKTLIPGWMWQRRRHTRAKQGKFFLLLFFKKRSACFLPSLDMRDLLQIYTGQHVPFYERAGGDIINKRRAVACKTGKGVAG